MEKNRKKIINYLLMFSIFGVIATLGYGLYYYISMQNKGKDSYPTKSFKEEYFNYIKGSTKEKLDYSTYSVYFNYVEDQKGYSSLGTAWSFGVNDDSWYLLTNLHVVSKYLLYKNSYGNTITNVERRDFGLNFQNFSKDKNSQMTNFFSEINTSISSNTSIEIISDSNENDSVKLFADNSGRNRYSLDIAMIRIRDRNIANNVLNDSRINKPLNLYKQNNNVITNLNQLDDVIVGGYPIKEKYYNWEKYYLEVATKNRFSFERLNYWNDYLYDNLKADDQGFKQRTSMLLSNRYIEDSDDDWSLSGGASGSPVYNSSDYKTNEPLWIPIAIYWGVLTNDNYKGFVRPCFTMLVSSLSGCTYNIFDNISSYLNIS